MTFHSTSHQSCYAGDLISYRQNGEVIATKIWMAPQYQNYNIFPPYILSSMMCSDLIDPRPNQFLPNSHWNRSSQTALTFDFYFFQLFCTCYYYFVLYSKLELKNKRSKLQQNLDHLTYNNKQNNSQQFYSCYEPGRNLQQCRWTLF